MRRRVAVGPVPREDFWRWIGGESEERVARGLGDVREGDEARGFTARVREHHPRLAENRFGCGGPSVSLRIPEAGTGARPRSTSAGACAMKGALELRETPRVHPAENEA